MATWMKFLYMIMGFMKSRSNRKSNNKKVKKKVRNYRENLFKLQGVRNLEIKESSKKFSPDPLRKCLHSWAHREMRDPKMLQTSQHTDMEEKRPKLQSLQDLNYQSCSSLLRMQEGKISLQLEEMKLQTKRNELRKVKLRKSEGTT